MTKNIAICDIEGGGAVYEISDDLYEDIISDRKPVSAIKTGKLVTTFEDNFNAS